jgi:hypothetical protein
MFHNIGSRNPPIFTGCQSGVSALKHLLITNALDKKARSFLRGNLFFWLVLCLLPKVENDAPLLGWLLEQILQRNFFKLLLNFVS